jgi:hypothetical protein
MGADEFTTDRPRICFSPGYLDFYADEGGPNPASHIFSVSNCGANTLNWVITDECDWLSAEPNSGSSTGEVDDVNVIVDVSGLDGGVYYCELTISDPCAPNNPKAVEITLYVGPKMCSWPGYLDFNAPLGGGNPASEILSVRNCGASTLNWEITESCGWLTAEPNSGSSTGEVNEVTVSVNVSGLSHGLHQCDLVISDPCACNSPQVVDVNLFIPKAVIGVSATDFEFMIAQGAGNPNDQILGVENTGGGTLNWQISCDCNWLTAEPNSGSSTGEVDDVNLSVETGGFTVGEYYYCELTVSDPNAVNSPVTVGVAAAIDCIPPERWDYQRWVDFGRPACWCDPHQCRGDVDGEQEAFGKGMVWVGLNDYNLLTAPGTWLQHESNPALNPCADIDHLKEVFGKGTVPVGLNDYHIMTDPNNWLNPAIPADCP